MPGKPALIIHTGDITPSVQGLPNSITPQQLLSRLKVDELHTVPGEHDVTDGPRHRYFDRFGKASDKQAAITASTTAACTSSAWST